MKKILRYMFIWLGLAGIVFGANANIRITKIYSNSTSSNISICAHTDKYFNEYSLKKLKPFVAIMPKTNFSLEVSYKSICIGNLKPSSKYTVFISKNIPLDKKLKLDKDYSKELTTTNYKPSFSFKESGYILPQKGDISIPIECRNVDKLSIALYRINNNNLINAINEYGFVRALEYYDLDNIEEETGYKLWEKTITTKAQLNKKKIWAVDVGKYLKKRQSGVYILVAKKFRDDGSVNNYSAITQWFMISDIGIFTLEDNTGLYVYTKHLSDATVYNDANIELRAKNNEVLAKATVKNGKVTFKKALLNGSGGLRAQAIYAYGKNGDFSVLDLSHPSHDLSDRGVNGRSVPKNYDAFVYSNRGIFKPGESIDFNVIVKKSNQKSASNLKIAATLFDSSFKKIAKSIIACDDFGYANGVFKISKDANVGKYKIVLYADSKEPIGSLSFLVEDFVPPKIEVEIKSKPVVITPNKQAVIKATAKYLTGDKLADAEVNIQKVIYQTKNPFKKYKKYHFGKQEQVFSNEYLEPMQTKSDKDGNITIKFTPKMSYSNITLPLAIHIDIAVNEPGGRAVTKSINAFYANSQNYIGVRANFEDDYIDLNAKPSFNLVYLQNQKPSSGKLKYKLIAEEEDYSWSFDSGSWEYSVNYSDIKTIKEGLIALNGNTTDLLFEKLDWGSYRLEVTNGTDATTTYRFYVGYWGGGGKQTPDKLPLSINRQKFEVGDIIKVNIKPKFSGPVMVNIANSQIFKSKTIQAKENQNTEVEFKVDKSWGSSVYALATAFRAQSKTMGASRAIGVAHFSVINKEKLIDLQLKYPNKIRSKSKLSVEVSSNMAKNKKVYLTLAAVDKGILNLTKYKLPNPIKYFFGQLRLGVDIKDIYGSLIKAQGEHAKFSTGAGDEFDDSQIEDAKVSNKRVVVAKISKKTELINGKAKIDFDIPDFQGALKLQAVAWSKDGFGKASGEVIVKDPVSSELYMPLFLASGDKAQLTFRANFDKEAPKGQYIFKVKANNIKITPTEFSYEYSNNNSFIKEFNATSTNSGDASIDISVIKDGKTLLSRNYKLAIRDYLPKSYVRDFTIFKNGAKINAKDIIKSASLSKFVNAKFRVSSKPLLPIKAIKEELNDYSYRCAEQTTSRAFVLIKSKDNYEQNEVKAAIERLESLQHLKGGFGLWANSSVNLWISSYAMDFLTRANAQGYKVSNKSLREGLKYLENSINRFASTKEAQEANIYALYVLARNKKIFMTDIMHFANDTQSKVTSALAWGQLGATLKRVGEENMAKEIFSQAKTSLNSGYEYCNYGGVFRDKAALVVLLNEAGFKQDAQKLYIDLGLHLNKHKYLSTQEMSQIIRASNAIKLNLSPLKIKVGDEIYSSNKPYIIKSKDLNSFKTITNISGGDLWWDLSYIGIPTVATFNAIQNNGFKVTKNIYTLDGKEADLNNIAQGGRYVVLLSGEVNEGAIKTPLITDFLPSGFELENPDISGIDNTQSLSWLKNTTVTTYKEYRDDRFGATFNPKKSFKLAYIVRAVTIGEFSLPPVKIEDMYQPRYRAFSKIAQNKITIKEKSQITIEPPASDNNETNTTNQALSQNDYLKAINEPLRDLSKYSVYELNYLRNAIFAYNGLDFATSNPALHERFSKFSWYKPTIVSGSAAYGKLSNMQKENVQKLLQTEKKRLGGLTLADFYRINIKQLERKYLQRYSKAQLRILRNSLIARYGLKFQDEALTKIFSQLDWYKVNEDITSSEIIDKKMNTLQRANLLLILSVEKSK